MQNMLEHILTQLNITPSQLADETGISRATLSHILSGRNKPSLDVITRIHQRFPFINAEWLLTGSGNFMKNEPDLKPETLASKPQSHSPEVKTSKPVSQPSLFDEEMPSPTLQYLEQHPPVHADKISERLKKATKKSPDTEYLHQTTEKSIDLAVDNEIQVKSVILIYTDGTFELLNRKATNVR